MNEAESYEFDRQGYIVIKDMLDAAQVKSLAAAIDALEPGLIGLFRAQCAFLDADVIGNLALLLALHFIIERIKPGRIRGLGCSWQWQSQK